MSAISQIGYTYSYPFASHVEAGWGLRLATSGTAETAAERPYFFEGALARPEELADMLLVLSQVVRSRFYLPGAMRELDPVVTCSEEAMRFEGFSSCCGVYARADLDGDAFGSGLAGRGTTNVDFNAPMRAALGELRHGGAANLAVGADEVKLSSPTSAVVEKKVKLPVRWIKGFTEAQAFLARLRPALEASGVEARRFLCELPRGGSPKRPAFVVRSRAGLHLTQRATGDAVRVMGTERLRLLEPVAARARRLQVWGDEASGVSAWELAFDTGRLWLTISPDLARGFSGEGQVLEALSDPAWRDVLAAVRAQLRWQASIEPCAIGTATGLDERAVSTALAALASRGLVGFDCATGRYYHRELPFDLEKVESLHPRLRDARELVAAGGVRWQTRSGEGGEAFVKGSDVEHVVRIAADADHCTCRWFSRNQGERGPCSHILAARISLGESDDDR